jgi:hypothetical protein
MTREELHLKHKHEWEDFWLSQTDEYGQYMQSRKDKARYEDFKNLLKTQREEIAKFKRSETVQSEFRDNASDITERPYLYENLEGRYKEWAELKHDHDAIEGYYKAHGKEVPKATQNRMKKHVEEYQERWNLPYEPDNTLEPQTEKDFALYQNIHDIYEADFAIAMSYGTVPDSTNERLRTDLQQFFTMNEVYHALREESSLGNKARQKIADLKEKFSRKPKSQNQPEPKIDPRRKAFAERQQSNQQEKDRDKGMDID